MKNLRPLFFGVTFFSFFLFNAPSFNSTASSLEEIPVCDCIVELGDDLELELGDSVQLEPIFNCLPNQVDIISWTASETLSCTDCLNPTVKPLENTCYELSITWTDACVSTEEICVLVRGCEAAFSDNAINGVTPAEIDDTAEIELEIVRTQFVSIDIVDGDEILYSIWEGWLNEGLQTRNLDFSAVPAGNYELRARLYPENKTINIQKL